MKKKLLIFAILTVLLSPVSGVFAKSSSSDAEIKLAIKKYRAGNYTGCLQDCQNIVSKDPSNATAHYYMAISYVQAGKKDEAINAYAKVLSLKPNAILCDYANKGKVCLETPDQCSVVSSPNVDKFIKQNSSSLSDEIEINFEQRKLNKVKEEINNDKELDDYTFDKLNDASSGEQVLQNNKKVTYDKPSEKEINNAVKVLRKAGISVNLDNRNLNQIQAMQEQANPDLAQVQALLGMNSNNSKNDSMMNMLPYMMAQNKEGISNNYNPQMIQAVIMSSMMSNFDFNTNDDSK